MTRIAAQLSISSPDLREFVKFIIVGFSNFAVSFTVFYLSYEHWQITAFLLGLTGDWGETFLLVMGQSSPDGAFANTLAYICGVLNSFLWNRRWTFKKLTRTTKRLKRFILLSIISLTLSTTVIFIFVDILGWIYQPVWFVTMVFITLANFIGSKFWVFEAGNSNLSPKAVFDTKPMRSREVEI